MPTANGQKCQLKIVGCTANIYDQPIQAQSPNTKMTIDNFGWWVCDSCQPGFYWKEGNSTNQGDCILCEESISGCFKCNNQNYCTQCLEGFYMSLDKKTCIPPIPHCTTDPSNYRQHASAP